MAIQRFGTANMNDIRDFEVRNSIQLPKDYSDFLLACNGGVVQHNTDSIIIKDINTAADMDVLFGIKTKDTELDVQLWLDDYISDMPAKAIIIGCSHQHGLIVLLCDGKETGVYYWDHAYTFPDSSDESNTYFIADTFTDFVSRLL